MLKACVVMPMMLLLGFWEVPLAPGKLRLVMEPLGAVPVDQLAALFQLFELPTHVKLLASAMSAVSATARAIHGVANRNEVVTNRVMKKPFKRGGWN